MWPIIAPIWKLRNMETVLSKRGSSINHFNEYLQGKSKFWLTHRFLVESSDNVLNPTSASIPERFQKWKSRQCGVIKHKSVMLYTRNLKTLLFVAIRLFAWRNSIYSRNWHLLIIELIHYYPQIEGLNPQSQRSYSCKNRELAKNKQTIQQE